MAIAALLDHLGFVPTKPPRRMPAATAWFDEELERAVEVECRPASAHARHSLAVDTAGHRRT